MGDVLHAVRFFAFFLFFFLFSFFFCQNYSGKFIQEASISPEIPVTEVRKSWFAEPGTYPNGSPTVRVALQEPKMVTQ